MQGSDQEVSQNASHISGELIGRNGKYRIDKNRLLGRGSFGIVYAGYQEKSNRLREVAIKEFFKSQMWRIENDKDKQLVIFSKYASQLKSEYMMEPIDIFQNESGRWMMVSQLAKGKTLQDCIGSFTDPQRVVQFIQRITSIIRFLHYDALKNLRSTQYRGQQEAVGIMHRDIKPGNIVWISQDRDMGSMYLIDFGISKVVYSDIARQYNNCGTKHYKADEVEIRQKYSPKADIFSFGATLYEVLSQGQMLLNYEGLILSASQRKYFIQNRARQLKYKLIQRNEQCDKKWPVEWFMFILRNCLQHLQAQRWNALQLSKAVENGTVQRIKDISTVPALQFDNRQKLVIGFQQIRFSVVQHKINHLYELLSLGQERLNRFIVYTIIKLTATMVQQRYKELQLWYSKRHPRELQAVHKIVNMQRIEKARNNSSQKIASIIKQENQKNKKREGPGWIEHYLLNHPQMSQEQLWAPYRQLKEFVYQNKAAIIDHPQLASITVSLVESLKETTEYSEARIDIANLTGNIKLTIYRCQSEWSQRMKKEMKEIDRKGTHRKTIEGYRAYGSIKDWINREENRTDLELEPREE